MFYRLTSATRAPTLPVCTDIRGAVFSQLVLLIHHSVKTLCTETLPSESEALIVLFVTEKIVFVSKEIMTWPRTDRKKGQIQIFNIIQSNEFLCETIGSI